MEVGDATDHRGARDELITVSEEFRHQLDVTCIAFDEPVVGVFVVGPLRLSVLGEIVDANHLVTPVEQLLYDVTTDEPRGATYEHLAQFVFSFLLWRLALPASVNPASISLPGCPSATPATTHPTSQLRNHQLRPSSPPSRREAEAVF